MLNPIIRAKILNSNNTTIFKTPAYPPFINLSPDHYFIRAKITQFGLKYTYISYKLPCGLIVHNTFFNHPILHGLSFHNYTILKLLPNFKLYSGQIYTIRANYTCKFYKLQYELNDIKPTLQSSSINRPIKT